MFDIHCHIMFGCDDGSYDLDESVRMIAQAAETGTRGIVATAHSNIPGSYLNYWDDEIEGKFNAIVNEVKRRQLDVEIYPGHEIFSTGDEIELLKQGKLKTLNNSRYPLVEFDFYEHGSIVLDSLDMLLAEGYVPVVAHPERYRFVIEDTSVISVMRDMGCIIQVNKGSLLGNFGNAERETALEILENEDAGVIASDAHSPFMRTTDLAPVDELVCEMFSPDYATLLLDENPGLILQDKELLDY